MLYVVSKVPVEVKKEVKRPEDRKTDIEIKRRFAYRHPQTGYKEEELKALRSVVL